MSLGTKIKKLRNTNRVSQEELANRLNVTQKSISNFEADKTIPDFLFMQKLSEVFDVDLKYFMDDNAETFIFEKVENNSGGNIGCKIDVINNNFPEGILENIIKRLEIIENKLK